MQCRSRQLALEAVRGEATIAEMASQHGGVSDADQRLEAAATEGMAWVSAGNTEAAAVERERELEKLQRRSGSSWCNVILREASGR